jgi:hypothetical protein
MKFKSRLAIGSCAAVCWIASAQTPPGAGAVPDSNLALSPAVIMVRSKPGQMTTQTLTIVNHTPTDLTFNLATEDVVVRDGKRLFSPAGEIADGIAARAVVSPALLVVKAGEEGIAHVTLTVPVQTTQRAVVTFFRGVVPPLDQGTVGLNASLGALITFNLSSDYNVESKPVQASTQTPGANVILSEELRNVGTEPVVPKGVIVILNTAGKRVAKASFSAQRMLPGERLIFTANNPGQLRPGHYRTLSSFEFEQRVLTSAGEFTIPE